jgi:hypothetical protein
MPSCPPLESYTHAEQADVAEKKAANQHEVWAKMITDYGVLRERIRKICRDM